jgi:hypothetical protein
MGNCTLARLEELSFVDRQIRGAPIRLDRNTVDFVLGLLAGRRSVVEQGLPATPPMDDPAVVLAKVNKLANEIETRAFNMRQCKECSRGDHVFSTCNNILDRVYSIQSLTTPKGEDSHGTPE